LKSGKSPKETALCLANAADEYLPDFSTQVREHREHFEVRVTNVYVIMVVGNVRAADAGSSVTLRQPSHILTTVRDAMAEGRP